jgi:rSAM/selenodomain-associated transferase 2
MKLALVMPVLNEAAAIGATLAALAPWRAAGHAVIVVDGGSSDDTLRHARHTLGPTAALSARRGRAAQMNAGAAHPAAASAEALLFLHADTRLPAGAAAAVQQALQAGAAWGRFDVIIEGHSRWFPLIGRLINLRSRASGIATGDQAIFVRTSLFQQLGGYADQPLMEDIELCRRLKAHPQGGRPACLRLRVHTSGRRWLQHGVWRTVWLMWRLRWRYWRGESPEALARLYR